MRLFLSSHLPGPTPNICHSQAAKLILLNSAAKTSGSCSKAIVMPLVPLSAVVGSQPAWAGAQAGAAVAAGASVAAGCGASVAVAAGAQAPMAMLATTSTAIST